MKTRFFLTAILAGLCALRAGAAYELDFRITQEPVADPDTRTLSWLAEENGALYTLEASLKLVPPWFAVGYAPAAEDPDLLEDELVELEVTTDADRMFYRVVRDNGIRIEATCVEGEGVRLEVDATRWASRTPDLGAVIQMVIERSAEAGGPYDPVAVVSSPLGEVTVFDRTAVPDTAYYYRASFTWWDSGWIDQLDSPPSNVAYVYTGCAPPAGPVLTATCRPDRIVLNWSRPDWAVSQNGVSIQQWFLMRSTDQAGPFTPVNIGSGYAFEAGGLFVDTAISPETTYYYYAYFNYYGALGWWNAIDSPPSAVVSAATCDLPILGPMDVAFIMDNTGSMVSNAVTLLKENSLIDSILNVIDDSSGGDYRLALVSPDSDIVNVRLNFALENRGAFKTALQTLPQIPGGDEPPESTDECLNTVVNGLGVAVRPSGKQVNDFAPPFGKDHLDNDREALKVVVLITDNPPGGFDDPGMWEWTYEEFGLPALEYAQDARDKGIRIAAIMVGPQHVETMEIMRDYAEISCGWFRHLTSQGVGVEEAILDVIFAEWQDCNP